jgi:adenylate kinase family enzyme
MVLSTGDAAADELARQLADSRGLPLIALAEPLSGSDGSTAPALEQELERQHPERGFVLRDGPATPEQAASLDSLLDALDAPLELVIGIDTGQEAPAKRSAYLHPGADPLSDYYRERGLLRRIRSEGEAEDILAAAGRIVDDLSRAQRPEGEDPFAATLQAIARKAPPPAAPDAATAAAPGEEGGAVTEPETAAESTRPGPGWKRTAAQKGRLRRQPAAGKGGRKPRR